MESVGSVRDQLINYIQSLLIITPSYLESRYRLLPALSGRIVWMIRTTIATIAISLLILLNTNNPIPGGTSLIPIGTMLCLMNNFGSTNTQAYRAITGGAVGAGYSIAIAAIFSSLQHNRSLHGLLLSIVLIFIFLFIFIITLTNTSVVFKRVSMSITIVGLLLLYQDVNIEGTILNLHSWAGIAIGVAIAIGCSLLPVPIIDNATREIAIRLRINTISLQSRLGGLVIAFTHKPELRTSFTPPMYAISNGGKPMDSSINLPLSINSRKPSYGILDDELEILQETGELQDYETQKEEQDHPPDTKFQTSGGRSSRASTASSTTSSSVIEPSLPINMWTTERAPLLRSDIIDLQNNGNYILPVFSRLLQDIKWELIYYIPSLINLYGKFRTILYNAGSCYRTRTINSTIPTTNNTGFYHQATIWTRACARFHRVLGVMIIAELTLRSSPFHTRFIETMGEELCACVLALNSYMMIAVEQSTSFSIYRYIPYQHFLHQWKIFRPIYYLFQLFIKIWGLPTQSWFLPYTKTMIYNNNTNPGTADEHKNYEYPTPILLSIKRQELKQAVENIFRVYQKGRLQLYENLKLTTTTTIQEPSSRRPLQHQIDWHSEDLLALNAFIFTVLRCCQIVLTAAEEACDHQSTTFVRPDNHHQSQITIPFNTNFMTGGEDMHRQARPPRVIHKYSSSSMRQWICSFQHMLRQITRTVRFGMRYLLSLLLRFLRWLGILPSATSISSTTSASIGSFILFQSIRAIKVATGVTLAAGLAVAVQNVFGATVYYWAPITAAFLVGSADGGAWRTSALRLQGTVAGAIYGYLVILIANQSIAVLVSLLAIWAAIMTYPRAQPHRSYWSLVSTLTAFVIVLGLGPDTATVDAIALGRVKQTILGILSYLFVSNIFFPISARTICKQRLIYALHETRNSVTLTIQQFITLVEQQSTYYTKSINHNRTHRRRKSLMHKQDQQSTDELNRISASVLPTTPDQDTISTKFTMEPPSNTTSKLPDVDETLTTLVTDLLDEASIEPALWRPIFIKSRYTEIIDAIRRTLRGISIIHQCTMSLYSEAEEQQHLAKHLHQQWPMMLSQRQLSTNIRIPSLPSLHNLPYQLEGLPPTAFLYESHPANVSVKFSTAEHTNIEKNNVIIHMHITGKAMREYTPVLPYLITLMKSLDETLRLVLIILNYGTKIEPINSIISMPSMRKLYPKSNITVPLMAEKEVSKPMIEIPSTTETKMDIESLQPKEEISSEAIMHESFIVGSTETTITQPIEKPPVVLPTDAEERHELTGPIITTTTTEPTGTIMLPFLPHKIRELPYNIAKLFRNMCKRCYTKLRGQPPLPSISIPANYNQPPSSKAFTGDTKNRLSSPTSILDEAHIEALNQLPLTVELLLYHLAEYKTAYDTLLHKAVSKVPVRMNESTSTTPLLSTSTISSSSSPWIDISPLDAICFNTASFGIKEISEAVTDIARIARRLRDI